MQIDTEVLLALAGLEPMPRRELTVNPCPEGYALTNVGGRLMCVLEGDDQLSLEEILRRQLTGESPSATGSRGGGIPPRTGVAVATGSPRP
jgi:hypothetical protein